MPIPNICSDCLLPLFTLKIMVYKLYFFHWRSHHWPVNRYYFDSTMRWYRLYVGTLFGNLTPTNHSLPRTGTSHFTTSHLALYLYYRSLRKYCLKSSLYYIEMQFYRMRKHIQQRKLVLPFTKSKNTLVAN